jgi:hypothetical protein
MDLIRELAAAIEDSAPAGPLRLRIAKVTVVNGDGRLKTDLTGDALLRRNLNASNFAVNDRVLVLQQGATAVVVCRVSGALGDGGSGSGGNVPSGGAAGQILVKASAADYNTSWLSRPFVATSTHGVSMGDTGNQAGAVHNARDQAVALGVPLVFDQPGICRITSSLDIRREGLKVYGLGENKTRIKQATPNIPVVLAGMRDNTLTDMSLEYAAQPSASDTGAVALQLYNGFMGYYARLAIITSYQSIGLGQSEWPVGNGQNTVFSTTFENIRCLGWRKNALDLRSYVGASTANLWLNTYLHNNYGGSPETSSDCAVLVQGFDDTVFSVLNIEQCIFSGSHAFVNNGSGVTIDGLHYESVTMQASGTALFQSYDRALSVIRNLKVQSTTFSNATGHAILNSGGGSGSGTSTVMPRTRLDGWRWLGGNPTPAGQLFLHRSSDGSICRVVVDPNDPRCPVTALRNNGGGSSVVVVDGVSGT